MIGKVNLDRYARRTLGACLLALFLLTPTMGGGTASAEQTQSQLTGCAQQISQAANIEAQSFQQGSAVLLAEGSWQFSSVTVTYKASFDSVFDSWSFDSSCHVALTAVNIVFQLRNATENAGYVIVRENPEANQVVGVSIQVSSGTATTNTYWSGYEMAGNADDTTYVYESIADWSIPSVSQPYSGACTGGLICSVLVWPGLVRTTGGGTGVAQAGTESNLTCGSVSCIAGYNMWYEFYPQEGMRIICNSHSGSGDSIEAYVLNQGITGGNTSLWNLEITDSTIDQSCTVTGHADSGIGTPRLAEFLLERPSEGLSFATLPKFTTVAVSGSMYYGGSAKGIYTPYSNGWYTQYVMKNSGYTNINTTAVGSSNSFSETYNTGQGT